MKTLPISLAIAFTLLAPEVPEWISIFGFAALIYRFFADRRGWKIPSPKLTTTLAVLLIPQVYFQFRTLFDQDAGTTWLIGLTALKILDQRTERDRRVLILLNFLLLSLKSTFSLNLQWFPLLLVGFAFLWLSLLNPLQTRRWTFLGRMFAFSVPLALVLFIVFPRLVVPWASQRTSTSRSQMGFSDQLSPTGVAELAESDFLVFRARILEGQVHTEDLYWRGAVLLESKGLDWSRGRRPLRSREPVSPSIRKIRYDILAEPSSEGYLFTLERSLTLVSNDVFLQSGPMTVYRVPIGMHKAVEYQGISDFSASSAAEPAMDPLFTQLPDLEPEVQTWVNDTLKNHPDSAGKWQEVKKLFQQGGFTYSLKPGQTKSLAEFLFRQKRGFCEHFAGAAATLARALGFPARVVVGFHGGSYNPFGEFWRITTRDAHAWIEIYREGRWYREDPTGWVAPARLSMGSSDFFNQSQEDSSFAAFADLQGSGILGFFNRARSFIEDMNFRWTRFLLDFDRDSQRNLWTDLLGQSGPLLLVMLLLGILWSLLRRQKHLKGRTPAVELLEDVILWGSERSLPRQVFETPREYLNKIRIRYPTLSTVLAEIETHFENARYRSAAHETSWKDLKSRWRTATGLVKDNPKSSTSTF